MDLERKSKQSVQGNLYVRFLCFENGSLSALHDRSYGFYRRQIILTVKDVPPDRVDDPYLIEKLQREADDIFLWCLEGLKRLLKNEYRFTISERAKKNLHEAMESGNNIIDFMQSSGYIRLEENTTTTSKNLSKKASVLEKLHRYQQEGRQQPKRSVKKKSMDRER